MRDRRTTATVTMPGSGEAGVTLTEYALVLALVVAATIPLVQLLGGRVSDLWQSVVSALLGT